MRGTRYSGELHHKITMIRAPQRLKLENPPNFARKSVKTSLLSDSSCQRGWRRRGVRVRFVTLS